MLKDVKHLTDREGLLEIAEYFEKATVHCELCRRLPLYKLSCFIDRDQEMVHIIIALLYVKFHESSELPNCRSCAAEFALLAVGLRCHHGLQNLDGCDAALAKAAALVPPVRRAPTNTLGSVFDKVSERALGAPSTFAEKITSLKLLIPDYSIFEKNQDADVVKLRLKYVNLRSQTSVRGFASTTSSGAALTNRISREQTLSARQVPMSSAYCPSKPTKNYLLPSTTSIAAYRSTQNRKRPAVLSSRDSTRSFNPTNSIAFRSCRIEPCSDPPASSSTFDPGSNGQSGP